MALNAERGAPDPPHASSGLHLCTPMTLKRREADVAKVKGVTPGNGVQQVDCSGVHVPELR
eukprot:2141258-Rhodomonas_salina.1